MLLKDISFTSPEENILYDEVLLHLADQGKGGEVLRFWESPSFFVVLGRISKEQEDLNFDNIVKDQIPVLRRSSGGGTVLQGPGCLNFSLILSKEQNPEIVHLKKSYEFVLTKVVQSLKNLGIESEFLPVCDVALAPQQKKVSGNAQKRGKKFILHHGTLLYGFDLKRIDQYLRMPKDVPAYRGQRSHLEFVANLPCSADKVKKEMKHVFNVAKAETQLNDDEQKCLKIFLDTKNICVKFS